jgi:hypothetical protein
MSTDVEISKRSVRPGASRNLVDHVPRRVKVKGEE